MRKQSEGEMPYSLGSGRVLVVTTKSFRVLTADEGVLWIPKGQLYEDSDLQPDGRRGDEVEEVVVKQWWAEKKGFI